MVYIFELTNSSQVNEIEHSAFYTSVNSKLVSFGHSNTQGFFQFYLPEGKYSIFVKEKSLYYSNSFDGQDNIYPFEVKKDSLTYIEFNITYMATF
jgi:hypothetical protein